MAYTPATSLPILEIFQWSTPDYPNPMLSQPISDTDTTIYWTAIPKDKDGNTITGNFLMNAKNTKGYTEQIYIPAGKVHADGLGADDVIRGVRLTGLDYTTGDPDLAVDLNQDSPIGCTISPINFLLMTSAMQGSVGSGGDTWKVGDGSAQDIHFQAFIDHTTDPDFYWDNSDMRWKISRGDDDGAAGVSELSGFMELTTIERDALTNVPNGGLAIYNTTLGQTQWREGGSWVSNASGGSVPNASPTVAGKVEKATSAESQAGTDTGGTGAENFVAPSDIAANEQNQQFSHAVDSVGTDAYAITLTPAIAAYADGQQFTFEAGTANTGACTLNVNAKGAKAIKKKNDQDLETGDIEAGQKVLVSYDLTNDYFQMLSQPALFTQTTSKQKVLQTTRSLTGANGTVNVAHGLSVTPDYVQITANCFGTGTKSFVSVSNGWSDGSSNYSQSFTTGDAGLSSSFSSKQNADRSVDIHTEATANIDVRAQKATVLLDSTNVAFNWTFTDAGTAIGTIYLTITVYYTE